MTGDNAKSACFSPSFILCAVLIVLDTLVVAIQSVLNIHSIFFEQGFVSTIVMLAFVNIVSHSFIKKI